MRRLSNVLLCAGLAVCCLGVLGLTTGVWFNLSQRAVRAIAMALPFVVGAVLLVVGAMVGRAGRDAARDAEGRETDAALRSGQTAAHRAPVPRGRDRVR